LSDVLLLMLLLQGQEAPVVEIYPEQSVTIEVGGSAVFQCRVTHGYPSPTVSWKRFFSRSLSNYVYIVSHEKTTRQTFVHTSRLLHWP